MLVCPVCGFRNPHSNDRCLKCSALLQRNEEIIGRAMYDGAEKARKQWRKDFFNGQLERFARAVSIPSWKVQEGLPYRFPFNAGGLSIVPGLGQFYNRQPSKGTTLGLAWFAFLLVCLATLRQPFSNVLLLALVLGWMWIWNDAVGTAIRSNGQHWSLRNSLALIFGAMFLVGITVTGLQFFGLSIVSLLTVRQDVQKPLIRAGDRIWINHTRYWFTLPKVGQLIFYDPPRFTAEVTKSKDVYSINIKSYFQRVLATEGDLVEKKGGVFYRNGDEIPKEQWPIGGDILPDFSITVPLDHVCAPVTHIPQDTLGNMIGGAISSGMGVVSYVGQSDFIFAKWQQAMLVPSDAIWGKAVAVVDPPEHRQWF